MKENNINLIEEEKEENKENFEENIAENIVENIEKINQDKDKERLIEILERVKDQIDQKDKETVIDVYLSYSEAQLMENKEIKFGKKNTKSKCCYKFSLFLITSIFLIGSFVIASLKKSCWNLFYTSFKCYAELSCNKEDFIKQSNFFEYFHEQLFREPVDLNLIMFWNFIGIKLLNSIGFRPTTIIFLIFNILILYLTYNINYEDYDPKTYKYSFQKLILLFINWTLMAISFGGSSLLAQQKLIDFYTLLDHKPSQKELQTNYTKLLSEIDEIYNVNDANNENIEESEDKINNSGDNANKKEIKNKKENIKEQVQKQKEELKNKNFAAFGLFSLAIIIGYTGKYGLGFAFKYYKTNIINEKNETTPNDTKIMNFFQNITNNDTDINYEINKLSQNIFLYICTVYIGCILISFIFYSFLFYCFFEKKKLKNEKDNKICCSCCLCNTICELSGFFIYFENIILNKDKNENKGEKTPGCCRLCCEVTSNYCNDTICNMCDCREAEADKNLCCCSNYNEKHFDKEIQCFCYCYQEKRIFYWINKFCNNKTQKKVLPCIIIYFITKLSTLGCQEKYENMLKNNYTLKEASIFLASLAICFLIFSFIIVHVYATKKLNSENGEEESRAQCSYRTVLVFILFFNIVLGFDYSYTFLFSEFGEDTVFFSFDDEKFMEKYSLYNSILFSEYFIFLVNYYCLIITKNRIDFELIFSQSISISIYLSIINLIIYLIKQSLQTVYNNFIFQFAFTSIWLLIFILIEIFRCKQCFVKDLTERCDYSEGNCTCNILCCNKDSKCFCQFCEEKCSECHCNFLCCEPWCPRYFGAFVDCLCLYFSKKDD